MLNLTLEIPNESHKAEYGRVMDKWEQLEQNIQPELMRRYSEKRNGNIPYDIWLSYCEDDRTTGSMLSTNTPCTLFFCVDGFAESADDSRFTVKQVNQYGKHDGTAYADKSDVTQISCDTENEISLLKLYNYNKARRP